MRHVNKPQRVNEIVTLLHTSYYENIKGSSFYAHFHMCVIEQKHRASADFIFWTSSKLRPRLPGCWTLWPGKDPKCDYGKI